MAKGGANLPKRAPRPWRAPQAVMTPLRFEGQRGSFEASDAQRAHYELRRTLRQCPEIGLRKSVKNADRTSLFREDVDIINRPPPISPPIKLT